MLLDSLGASKQPSWCKQAADPQVVAGEPSTAHGDTQGRFLRCSPKKHPGTVPSFSPQNTQGCHNSGVQNTLRGRARSRSHTRCTPAPPEHSAIAPTLTKAPRLAPSSNSHKIHSQQLYIPRSCPLSPSVTHWQARPSRVRAARSNVAG